MRGEVGFRLTAATKTTQRIDKFRTVVFGFQGVNAIGQAFADEIFRVFRNKHPEFEIIVIKAASAVRRMVSRAQSSTTL